MMSKPDWSPGAAGTPLEGRTVGSRGSHVHRSVSLQQHRRTSDRNNNNNNRFTNSGSNIGLGSNYYSCSNFQLAHLLARAASYDAKWSRALQEHSDNEWRVEEGSCGSLAPSAGSISPAVSPLASPATTGASLSETQHVTLPRRYQILAARKPIVVRQLDECRDGKRNGGDGDSDTSTTVDGSYLSDTTDDVDHSESRDLEELGLCGTLEQRDRDMTVALQWIKQEIMGLKVEDRAIMRQLFELGTVVRRLTGDLHEATSCQIVQQPLDVINDALDEDIVTSLSPVSHLFYQTRFDEEDLDQLPRLESQCKAVSMVTVGRTPSSVSKKSLSLLQRFRSKFLRSSDDFTD